MNRRIASESAIILSRERSIVRASNGDTMKPSRARRMAGAMTCASGRRPHLPCASSNPATMPGVAAARPIARPRELSGRAHSGLAPVRG